MSIFSLAWGSSRAFFIERTKDEADPDPAVFMVALRVLPNMLVIAVDSMLMWVLMGGILGKTQKIKFTLVMLFDVIIRDMCIILTVFKSIL